MKTVGIIGGIAPESTIEYYRLIIACYREKRRDGSYPAIVINSIDMKKMLDFIAGKDSAGVTEYLLGEVKKLERAGADFGLLASNTPHIVFEDIRRQSPIPLLSIVEAASEAAQAARLRMVGLFGTRFTMQGRFYPEVFSKRGIEVVAPSPEEQEYIHGKYMGELVKGVFLPETKERLLEIVERMVGGDGIEGLILGGTELPLILRGASRKGIPFLDTTRIHVECVVAHMLG
jgi:aspartate racemase